MKRDEVGRAFDCASPSHRQEVLVEHPLFARREPGDVEREPRMAAVDVRAGSSAGRRRGRRRKRLDRVLHFPDHRTLETDEVAGKDVVEDLAPAVGQRLVAEGPPREQGEHLRAVAALAENQRSCFRDQLTALEAVNEPQLIRREWPEERHDAQRTALARHAACGIWQGLAPSLRPVSAAFRSKIQTQLRPGRPAACQSEMTARAKRVGGWASGQRWGSVVTWVETASGP